jgi:phosphomevalonate kinase
VTSPDRIVRAPGKLLLTGAYAVLTGAPAVVVAVNRYAVAREGSAVDTRALYTGDEPARKLGLGSSAASVVACLGLAAATRGEDLAARPVRDRVFRVARTVHAEEQSGGSGVDVAASTYGGLLVYDLASGARTAALPRGIAIEAFFSGASARTSDLIGTVEALRARDAAAHAACLLPLSVAARAGAAAVDANDGGAFLVAARATGGALDALGRAADAPIVPQPFLALARVAEEEGAAFLPSGAGGGDVGVWIGPAASPPPGFLRRALDLGFRPLAIAIDADGLRAVRADEV